jgi:hypothetical protein
MEEWSKIVAWDWVGLVACWSLTLLILIKELELAADIAPIRPHYHQGIGLKIRRGIAN